IPSVPSNVHRVQQQRPQSEEPYVPQHQGGAGGNWRDDIATRERSGSVSSWGWQGERRIQQQPPQPQQLQRKREYEDDEDDDGGYGSKRRQTKWQQWSQRR